MSTLKTITVKNEREFKKLFNSNFQPRHVKSVNGISVNNGIRAGMQNINTLKVSHKHVTIENYSVEDQSLSLTFINSPFTITY